jgi:hypothetical protein
MPMSRTVQHQEYRPDLFLQALLEMPERDMMMSRLTPLLIEDICRARTLDDARRALGDICAAVREAEPSAS